MKRSTHSGTAMFLAAIMILSVVAMTATFAGPVAAQQADNRTPTSETVQPGEQVTVEVQISSDSENIELYNEEITTGSNIANITTASSDTTQTLTEFPADSFEFVYLSPVDSDTITYTVQVSNDASPGDTIELTGEIVDSSSSETDTGTTTITVEDTSDGGDPVAGPFTLSNLNPTEADVEPNEQITVSANVLNTGSDIGGTAVNFTIDGQTVASKDITDLSASNDTEVEFTVPAPDAPGTYTHGIETADDSVSGTLNVGGTLFEVAQLNPSSDTVAQGELIDVSAVINNAGSINGSSTVDLQINAVTVKQQTTPELSSGGSIQILFSDVDTSDFDPDTYTLTVETEDASEASILTIETSVVTYQNDVDEVDTDGLLDALSDWRNNEIGVQLLLDVLADWRSNR